MSIKLIFIIAVAIFGLVQGNMYYWLAGIPAIASLFIDKLADEILRQTPREFRKATLAEFNDTWWVPTTNFTYFLTLLGMGGYMLYVTFNKFYGIAL